MEDIIIPIIAIVCIFVVFPTVLFSNITKWKQNRSLSVEDENLMDELYDLARRLTDRVETVERIVAADNPNFRPGLSRPENTYAALSDDRHERVEREDELRVRRDRDRDRDRGRAPRSRFER